MTVWTIELPWDRPPVTMNSRLHWAEHRRIKQAIHDAVYLLAVANKLPRGLPHAHVTLHWQPAVRRDRDLDNPQLALKHFSDALTRGSKQRPGFGLVRDDTHDIYLSTVQLHPVARPARMWLTVSDEKWWKDDDDA